MGALMMWDLFWLLWALGGAALGFFAGYKIGHLKGLMLENGAILSRMSGSGPTVLGLFENEAKAESAYKIIKNHVDVAVCVSTLGSIPKA